MQPSVTMIEPRSNEAPRTSRSGFPVMDDRYRGAAILGGLVAVVLFAWVLFIGRPELTEAPSSDFHDLQARSLMDGQWDIAPQVDPETGEEFDPLSIEAFVIDGRSYLYFGPVPAVMRMPVLALTDSWDGRLTQPSMLLAYIVALVGASTLGWRVRYLVRGSDPVSRFEGGVTLVFLLGLGAGTVLLYLGSQPVVYHEAVLWGLAFSLLAYTRVLAVVVRPGLWNIAGAGVFATLAILSRASVGLGPVAALALLLVGHLALIAWKRFGSDGAAMPVVRWFVPTSAVDRRRLGALALAVLVPVTLYAAVNHARFGTLFTLPLEEQVFSDFDPNRQAALEANDGSLFGLSYVPTTLLQYARPDAIEIDTLAPWVNFPRTQATTVGDVVLDTRDEASSVPSSMPLLTVLGIVGLIGVVRAPTGSAESLLALRVPLVGAAVGTIGMLSFALIAHRYLGDVLPLLVLAGFAGLWIVVRWLPAASTVSAVAAQGGLAVLGLWGLVANVGLAVEYQRLIAPVETSSRTDFVELQYRIAGSQEPAMVVDEVGQLPDDPGRRGDVAVVGAPCRAVYWSDGFGWNELPEADGVCERLEL